MSSALVHGSYNQWLVAVSFLLAILTSWTALVLAGRITANHGGSRIAWLFGGAVAMGSGIWCMHYTGMLAFDLPMTVSYHLPTVLWSLLAAIAASFIALFVVSRERLSTVHVLVGSLLMGLAIDAMHYIGMAAMRMQAMLHYNGALVALSMSWQW